MSIRPRTLVTVVVVAFLLIGAAGCSNGQASLNDTVRSDADETEPTTEPPCEATATVNGTTYHVVKALSRDYQVNPTVQLEGTASDCSGAESSRPMTFHAIPHVDPTWAVCGVVDGEWRVFVADNIPPVPADDPLAKIIVGE
jgi:hypothetical protein